MVYDPIKPEIDPASICKEVFVRAYAEPDSRKPHKDRPTLERPASWFDDRFFVFDTETVNHELTFGTFEFYDHRKCVKRAIFYRDELPTEEPAAFEELRRICRTLDVPLYSLAFVFSSYIWQLRKKGGTFVGFNVNYDLSRIASSWEPATISGRRGARFINGFAFKRVFTTPKDEDGEPILDAEGHLQTRKVAPTYVRIRRDDRHHVRYDVNKGRVLDLATLAFALRDKNDSLKSACEAFSVEFNDRPGFHDGTVTEENVAGCLYDVKKTSALLYALGREFDRHPIELPPSGARSGASIAKAYLRAFGVQPRSKLQPDFPKNYLGFAATAYYGGWVEARIVRQNVPCMYLDAVSMYPSVFELLDLVVRADNAGAP